MKSIAIIVLLGVVFLLGFKCVRLVDERNALAIERYAPLMEMLND